MSLLRLVRAGMVCSRTVQTSSCSSISNILMEPLKRNPSLPFKYSNVASFHSSGIACVTEDRETKTVALWSNVKDMRASPVPALVLGLSGLVPFIAGPAYMISQGVFCSSIAFAHTCYGASILSFLGGVRWGFTLYEENPVQPDWVNLGYSVLPSLVAWGGLLLPQPLSCFTLMAGLTATAYCDMAMYGYPPWFKGLRFVLSFVAILTLWTVFMCSMLLPKDKETKLENEEITEK